jgi:hypothetical protein
MTDIYLIQANLGGMERRVEHAQQELPPDVRLTQYYFTDENFLPRQAALTPRMQAKIPKLFGWQMVEPRADVYIWLDASFQMQPGAVAWLYSELGSADLAIFKHPSRTSIALEADHLRKRLAGHVMRAQYIRERYADERLEEMLDEFEDYVDDKLFACGCFIYRPSFGVQDLMKNWWHYISRYHINDQLSFPFVLSTSGVAVHTIDAHIYKCPHLLYCRGDR